MDFWDEFEEFQSESSSDELNTKDSSLDEPSSNEDNVEVGNRQGDNSHVGLEDQYEGLKLGDKECSFKPVCNDDAGSYLQGMKGCGLSATEKQKRRCNQELKKLVFETRSIVEIFSTHREKNQSHDKNVTPDAASVASPPKTSKEGRLQKVETLFEKQT